MTFLLSAEDPLGISNHQGFKLFAADAVAPQAGNKMLEYVAVTVAAVAGEHGFQEDVLR